MNKTVMMQSENMSAAGELLAGIVHELNNPLTTILGYSELLLQGGALNPAHLKKIHDEAERSIRIVQNILQLARGGRGPEREIIDVNSSIRQTANLAASQLKLNQIALELELSPLEPKVLAQDSIVTQVLLNLVTNAMQAIAAEKSSGIIRISSAIVDNSVSVTVSDNGPGIAAASMHRIFEAFFTTRKTGHGLGLNLSRKLVRENGGDLRVSSIEGDGATFTLEMPLALRPSGGIQASSPAQTGAMPGGLSVLIVDDDDRVAEFVETVMRSGGYETDRRSGGSAAIELLQIREYDVLICDLHMQGTNGRNLIEWIRANRKSTSVLLLSGDVVRQDTADYLKSCGAHFLAKPFTVAELSAAVQKLHS